MNYFFIILLILLLVIIFYLYYVTNKQYQNLKETKIEEFTVETIAKCEAIKEEKEREVKEFQQSLEEKQKNLKQILALETQKHEINISKLEKAEKDLESLLKEKEKRYNEVNQDLDLYKEGKIKEINNANEHYKEIQKLLIDEELGAYRKRWTNEINDDIAKINDQRTNMLKDLDTIKSILEDERSKRAAINEELRKAEEKEKYNEIHSVQLTDNEKEDIHFLLSLEDKLHNKQVLYKLVWSTYLQQAYKNTFHNILGSRDPRNVIYCIENINTGKKYIGKTSAEVSKRWTEHIKTSLNIGTIKTTNIHKALYNHWDEFIFYIVAETEKEKLSEMEKYYISFYESDKYGYNIKAGG